MKTCNRCGESKPLSEFGVERGTKDGHKARCKACVNAWHRQHSAANLVVCCRSCNCKKLATPFDEWLDRLPEGRREAVAKLYQRKHGAPPVQRGLPWAA